MRPRYSAWLSIDDGSPIVIPIFAFAMAILDGASIWYWCAFGALAICLLGMGWRAWEIWRERANPPAVRRFWHHSAGFELEVRCRHTGEVLLQRREPHLQDASLLEAKLAGADLRGVSLRSAQLRDADLRGADLRKGELAGADLRHADLRRARLNGACLSGTLLGEANLCGADLWGAVITGSDKLSAADFSGAQYDETTRWPAGFDPERRRCRFTKSGEGRLPIPARHPPIDREDLPLPASTHKAVALVNEGLPGRSERGDVEPDGSRTTAAAKVAPAMRPRYSDWVSGGISLLIPAVVVFALAIPGSGSIASEFGFCALAILSLAIGWRAWAIWRERANPPPVLRFWDNSAGFKLEVRCQHTGEVLLQRRNSHLQYADLEGAKLAGADLREVSLRFAKLRRADLRGADLRKSGLAGADLRDADLRRARLNGAYLNGARLDGANLCGADLWGAELTDYGNLGAADFSGARYDETTSWPAGFDPYRHRCRLTKNGEGRLPIPATHSPLDREDLPLTASTSEAEAQVNRAGREHS